MQQVPTYLIIGDGRLARHMFAYLKSHNFHVHTWSRKSDIQLHEIYQSYSHILLCISDNALENFVEKNEYLKEKTLVHFSGATEVEGILSFHPLMTFADELYSSDFYQTIPFIDFNERTSFNEVFPAFKNPTLKVDAKLKAYYHSLCVMGGNFTTLLWAKCTELFFEIGLDSEMIKPYMQKVFENTLENPHKNLTGPLVRGDTKTIEKNIAALLMMVRETYISPLLN